MCPPKEAIKIEKDKVKAALEKRRKERAEMTKRKNVMDEDDLIERELEDGVELGVEGEKIRRERRPSWSRSDELDHEKGHEDMGDGKTLITKGQSSRRAEGENADEGKMLDDASPIPNSRKRKGSPIDRQTEGKKRNEHISNMNRETGDDGRRMGRFGYGDKDHRRHGPENGYTAEREHRRHVLETHRS